MPVRRQVDIATLHRLAPRKLNRASSSPAPVWTRDEATTRELVCSVQLLRKMAKSSRRW